MQANDETLWGRTVRTTRRLTSTWGTALVALLVWTGKAMAVTTAPQGDGGTLFDGGSTCEAAAQAPASQNLEHADGDDVILPLYEHVNDLREDESAFWTSRFQVVADYQGVQSNSTHDHQTDGDDAFPHYVNHTVPNVSESTSMDVTYNVWVYDDSWIEKCSDSDTTTFTFV